MTPLPVGKAEYLCKGKSGLAVIAVGNRVLPAFHAARQIQNQTGMSVTVLNGRWIKPLPKDDLRDIFSRHHSILLLEEGALAGGFSSAVLEFCSDAGLLKGQRIRRLGLPDVFVEHGAVKILRKRLKLDLDSIRETMLELLRGEES
jgi:1-deoxy-D-xylulose-5-phosphate synthase